MNFGKPMSDVPRYAEPVPVRTLVLFGPEDHVVAPTFMDCCRVAFPNRVGPLVVPGAGHFLQWEAADVFNGVVDAFLGDVKTTHARR
jgi:pimeloyl-ACP methyl ester carboxylesterase